MADFMVLVVTMVMFLQVFIIGAALLLGAADTEPLDKRASSYQPMEILTARAAKAAAAAATALEHREAA